MHHKIYQIIIAVEILLTVLTGLVLLKIHKLELSIIATVVGSLITLMTYAIPLKIKIETEKYYKKLDNFFEILKLSITIEKHPKIKEDIIKECTNDLQNLLKNIVWGDTYYRWLYGETKKCNKSIQAISSMPCEWWELQEEKNYYAANREAKLKRNVSVERIFILSRNALNDQLNRKIILKHIMDGINTYILFTDQLSNSKMDGVKKGMTIFDDELIFIDVVLPPEKAGGKLVEKKDQSEEFKSKKEDYELIKPDNCITSIDILSKTINLDKKELLNESCGILLERYGNFEILEEEIGKSEKDECKKHDYTIWKEYRNVLNSNEKVNEK